MSIAVHWNNSQTCYCHANVHIIYHDGAWAVSPGYSLISLTSILSITRLFNWKPVTISTSPPYFFWITLDLFSSSFLSHIYLSVGIIFFSSFFPIGISSSSPCYTSTICWLLCRFSWSGSLIDCSDHSLPLIPLNCFLWDKAFEIYYPFNFCLTSTAVT